MPHVGPALVFVLIFMMVFDVYEAATQTPPGQFGPALILVLIFMV